MTGLAKRFNQGKVQISYIMDFWNALQEFCRVCQMGADKYGRDNWKSGLSYKGVADSLLRHLGAFLNGEDRDAESGLHHMAHAAWNALVLLEYTFIHPELDDRSNKIEAHNSRLKNINT